MGRRTVALLAAAFLASLAYACVRYLHFQGVPPAHFPLFVLNKAVALSALVVLGFAVATRDHLRNQLGRAGFGLASLHILLALPLVSPAYFPALFEAPAAAAAKLTARGELVLLLGALAAILWTAPRWARPEGAADASGPLRLAAVAVVGLHAAVLGWPGWWTPAAWPGLLPPISLLSALVALVALAARLLPRRPAG